MFCHSNALIFSCFSTFSSVQSFTRVIELVLQAYKRDVDSLLGSLDEYLDKVALEDDRVVPHLIGDSQKNCAC